MAEQETSSGLEGFGKKLMNLFIKDEPTTGRPIPVSPQHQPSPVSVPIPPAGPVPAASVREPTASSAMPEGAVDTKFVDHFAAVLSKANQQGPDYFEFRETLKNLSNLNLSEDQQYQAAWASFKAMGGSANVTGLVSSANQYLTALNNDQQAFSKTVEAALSEKVGGLSNEQKQLQSENEQLAKQMLEIQRKMDANNERLAKIGGELNEQQQKITQNQSNYEATLAVFVGQIKRDLLKLGEYIK
jgi:vacuolar-type H+-ATPase subunit I/STV1